MTLNSYFPQGTKNQQDLMEDLIVASIQAKGQEFFYIPRELVAKNEILGEDRLSEYKNAYPIEMYIDAPEKGFSTNHTFIKMFGSVIDKKADLIVARRRWEEMVGRYGESILPNRPAEGDLLYFPLTDSMLVISFVDHQRQFYQVGKLYTYTLAVEMFTYSSERISTGIHSIDQFETLKSMDPAINPIQIPESFGDNTRFQEAYQDIGFDANNPFGEVP